MSFSRLYLPDEDCFDPYGRCVMISMEDFDELQTKGLVPSGN